MRLSHGNYIRLVVQPQKPMGFGSTSREVKRIEKDPYGFICGRSKGVAFTEGVGESDGNSYEARWTEIRNTARQEPCGAPPGEIARFRSASKALAGVVKSPRIDTRVPRSAVTGLRQRANSIEFSLRWTSVALGETSAPLG